jgi:glycosyltransferase involved in cell wall biosynthesis
MKNIWVITELYYPEETSTGYYLTRIAEGLAKDFQIKVLCGQPNYSARGLRASWHEERNQVEIFRCWGTTLDKNVIPFRLLNMLTLSLSIFWKAFWNLKKNEEVLVVTTPPSLPFIVAAASRLKGAKYILLIHDNYPEILLATEKAKPDSSLVRILNYFNGWLYKHCEKIIVVGRDMKVLVENKLKNYSKPIYIIPNWAELEQVEPRPRKENELLRELGLKDKFVLLYAGNMGHPNDLESIILCAKKLSPQEEFHFVFLGNGVKRNWLEKSVNDLGLKNVTILPPKPRSEQIVFLNACDVMLVSLVPKMWGVSMPSRTYNTLAAGKPMIGLTDEKSELALVIEEDEVGWVVPPNQPEKLLKAILEAQNNSVRLNEMGQKARKSALEKYSLEKAVENYAKVFNNNSGS